VIYSVVNFWKDVVWGLDGRGKKTSQTAVKQSKTKKSFGEKLFCQPDSFSFFFCFTLGRFKSDVMD
jgi:hypothetical protein